VYANTENAISNRFLLRIRIQLQNVIFTANQDPRKKIIKKRGKKYHDRVILIRIGQCSHGQYVAWIGLFFETSFKAIVTRDWGKVKLVSMDRTWKVDIAGKHF